MFKVLIVAVCIFGVLEGVPVPQVLSPAVTLQGFPSSSQLFSSQQPTLFVQTVQEETTLQDPSQQQQQQQLQQVSGFDLSAFTGAGTGAVQQDFSAQQSQQLRDPANPTADVFVHSGFPLQGVQLGGASGAQSPFGLTATPFARVNINSLQRGPQTVAQPQQQFVSGNQFQANLQHQLQQQQQLQQLQQQQVQQQQLQHQQQQSQQPQFISAGGQTFQTAGGQTFQTASGQTFTIPSGQSSASFSAAPQQQQATFQQQQQQPLFFTTSQQQQVQPQAQTTPLTGFRTVSQPISFIA